MFSPKILYRLWISLCLAALLSGAFQTNGSARPAADPPPGQGPAAPAPQAAPPADFLPDGAPVSNQPGGAFASQSQTPVRAPQGGGGHTPGAHFLHVSTTSNSSGNVSFLDHPLLNQQSSALFIATPNFQPNGIAYGLSDDAIGAYWSSNLQSWAVFYENSAMTINKAFNIYVPPYAWVFTHTTTASNSFLDLSLIDNPALNGHPEAKIFAMHNYSLSAGGSGAFHNQKIGVYYDTGAAKWGVYNEDGTPMATGVVFNVAISGPGDVAFTHIASAGNINSDFTVLDNPALNGNPNALLTVTPVFVSTDFNIPFDVHYDTSLKKWVIMADVVSFPIGAAFNVLVTPPVSGGFVHIVSAQNLHPTYSNYTALDNPYLNGNPDALVFVTHVLNAAENSSHWVYQAHPMGVVYMSDTFHTEGRWYIYTTDAAPLALWQAFNVYYESPQSNVVSVENSLTGSTSMTFSQPLLNGVPGATTQLTHNWNPDNHEPLAGYSFPYEVGFHYSSGWWQITRPSGPNLPVHLSYNLLAPQANSFTHLATVANISPSAVTVLDNALTDGNPWAMVFVTPNGSPGGSNKLIDEAPIGVFYNNGHWSIFNENAAAMTVDTGYNVFVVARYPVFLPQVKK